MRQLPYKLTNGPVYTTVPDAKFELIEDIPEKTRVSKSPVLGILIYIEEDLELLLRDILKPIEQIIFCSSTFL
jgi:hypothetical protein